MQLSKAYFWRSEWQPFDKTALIAMDERGARAVALAWGFTNFDEKVIKGIETGREEKIKLLDRWNE